MAYVVRFRRYRPSPRDDTLKWTQAVIEQSAPDGTTGEPTTWTQIEVKPIPDYPDPLAPPYMNATTELGTLQPGWYRIVFKDLTGDKEETAPQWYTGGISPRPSTKDVAVHIKNRTVDAGNNFLGDFTATTPVTDAEVDELIVKAENRVLRRIDKDPNIPIPTESQQAVKDLIALYAAMLVELTKYSEQVARGTSPYPQLKELFDETLQEVREDILGVAAAATVTGSTVLPWYAGGSGTAHYSFPDDVGGMIRWDTRF